MLVFEYKIYAKKQQLNAIDEAIRITQFIRNKCIRHWMDNKNGEINNKHLSALCAVLAKEFEFANKLNSMARQAASERAWFSISRFYDNCKKKIQGEKGYPQFQKDCRSVEYKTSGYKLNDNRKYITFTDKLNIGKLKLKGTRDLNFYQLNQIKRVRLIKRADGYYCQFCVSVERNETLEPSESHIGLDVGLKSFYTDSNGVEIDNPRFYRKSEEKLKKRQRIISRRVKGSKNRKKARAIFSKTHLNISRRRKDHAIKLARCVSMSNDIVVYENLMIRNMVKNHCLAKSINDAGWYIFRTWLERYAKIFDRVAFAVNPAYTSQKCSDCGVIVRKSLSTRTHICKCGCMLDRDHNAAINILNQGLKSLNIVGHTKINACGDLTSTLIGENLLKQVESLKQESPRL